jgi:hypothetical protein
MYFNNDPTMTNCMSPQIANGGVRATLNGVQIGTPIYSVSIGITLTSAVRTLSTLLAGPNFNNVTVHDGDVYTISYYRNLSATPTANDVPFATFSLRLWPTVANPGQSQIQNNNVQQQQVTPTLPTNVPLVAPIAVPQAGFKPGGALVLDGRNMSAVTSIKIGSTATTTVKTASGIEVKVPTDLAPGAHDLLVATATGSTLFVGAVKVADPAVVAAKEAVAKAAASILYRAPIDLTVGKTVSSAQAAAAKNFASQYRNAKSAVCIAIPATKATASAALAAANKVCGTFKAQIPGIKTTVVLGAPSGDKVNRVSAEVQG